MSKSWTAENAGLESINAWTHGVGFLASLPAGIAIIVVASKYQAGMVFACLIYSISLASMYLFSALSHAVRSPVWRPRVRAWDQGAVYLLIAGTYTPFMWAYLEGWQRLTFLLLVWGSAGLGFYSKVVAGHRLDNMTSITYVLLGWIPAMLLITDVTLICFSMMACGGVLYTVGTRFLQNDHVRWYFHAIWHLLVILASACHYAAIMMFPVLQLDK